MTDTWDQAILSNPTTVTRNIRGEKGGTEIEALLFIRSARENVLFPEQVAPRAATARDMEEILPYLQTFAQLFGEDYEKICSTPFTLVVPDSQNPYHQMYVSN